jgi:DNA-binding IclR family transcriptional regulator
MSELDKKIISTLMVMGAQSEDKALTAEDLASKLGEPRSEVEFELKSLTEAGYVQTSDGDGPSRVYLTGTGIITASSTYS